MALGQEFMVSVPPDPGDVRYADLMMDPRKVTASHMVGYGHWDITSADLTCLENWLPVVAGCCWALFFLRSDCGTVLWLHSHCRGHYEPADLGICEQGKLNSDSLVCKPLDLRWL